jgi:putative ABC transport system substrate-binding protein
MSFLIPRRCLLRLAGAAMAWPLAARAQRRKLPTIGYLGSGTPASWGPWTAAFVQRLRELGWNEGSTIAIEYRWAEGRDERYAEIAAEFVRLKVDVIVTGSSAPVLAAKRATSSIPIVFTNQADPVGSGSVASLARPGGNTTGLSLQLTDTAGKRVELLREIVPNLMRLAVMANAGSPGAMLELAEAEAAARRLGLDVTTLEIRQGEDIVSALMALKGKVDALYVVGDPLVSSNRVRILTLTTAALLPTIYNERTFVDGGGLISYGANMADLFRRGAEFVDKILRGTKPGDIPVEQPVKFDLVINLTTAKALGLTIPESFLWRANAVIE